MRQDVSVIDRLQLVERIKYASCDSNKKGTGSVCHDLHRLQRLTWLVERTKERTTKQ